jgi:hypothetical protein
MVNTDEDKTAAQRPAEVVTKRRRRKRPVIVALGALMLWFLGQGLGWFGGGPDDEPADDPAGRDAVGGQALGPGDAGGPIEAPAAAIADQLAKLRGAPGDGPGAASAAAEDAADRTPDQPSNEPEDEARRGPLVDADRFRSLVSLVESYISEQELGEAAGVIARMLAMDLTQGQIGELRGLRGRLEPLQKAAEERILAHVEEGQLLRADALSRRLVVSGSWQPVWLAARAAGLGLEEDWQVGAEGVAMQALQPAPLVRNRRVRIRWRGGIYVGVVVGSSGDQVTVQIKTASGQSYPTVRMVSCEPVAADAVEAIEMGLHALKADAPRLARLWLLRAHGLQSVWSERGEQLLGWLR